MALGELGIPRMDDEEEEDDEEAEEETELVGVQNTPSQNRVLETRHPAPKPDRRSRGCDRRPGVNPVRVEGVTLPTRANLAALARGLPGLLFRTSRPGSTHPRTGALFWCSDETG
jgi:hypothetical protein